MRNHASFRSALFQSSPPTPDCTNSACFGQDVAAWLIPQLKHLPFSLSEPIGEDYGYGFWVGQDIWVAIGIMDESVGAVNAEWLVSVAYDPGFNLKKRLFGKRDTAAQRQICQAVHAALSAAPEISEIRWCSDGEKDCGDTPA